MKKYIFVNQVTGPLFIDVLNAFAQNGENVLLYTGQIEKASTKLDEKIAVELSIVYRRNKAVTRVLTWTLFFVDIFFKTLFKRKNFEFFLVSNPPIAPFLGLMYKKLFGIKYHILIYDIYPDSLVRFNYISKDSTIFKTWARLNKSTFKYAENVFTISEYMEKVIGKYCGNKDKIKVIDNWVDVNFIKPIKKEENWFAKKYNLTDKLVILYSGNLGQTHDVESIIEAARILANNNKVLFLIIGDGVKKKIVESLIQKYGLENVLLLPFQESDVIPYSMTSADIAVITLAQGAHDLAVPSKTYYMMAAGNALITIADDESELSKLCKKYDLGKVVQPNSPDEIVEFIKTCLANEDLLNYHKKKSREASFRFTPENAKQYYNYVKKSS